ncbi:hypothetical protein ACFYM2_32520 [Streptomyces sp. NPDC006711]|uniref:hypothetical protein n=1 Tax=unclassified Streptomyces TaxID=2593676 RepID=UPI00368035C9
MLSSHVVDGDLLSFAASVSLGHAVLSRGAEERALSASLAVRRTVRLRRAPRPVVGCEPGAVVRVLALRRRGPRPGPDRFKDVDV